MTNNQALGYVTIAYYNILKKKGLSFDEIKENINTLLNEMYWLFDIKTEEEAEEIGNIIKYSDSYKEIEQSLKNYRQHQPTIVIKATLKKGSEDN